MAKIIKMEVDYSQEYPKWIEEMQAMKNIDEVLDKLYSYEKLSRVACDAITTGKLLVFGVELCADAKQWQKLNENLLLFSKRRGQLKQAVTSMVQKACTYVDVINDEETKLEFIKCIRNVTEGKIYVENERARISKRLAEIKEQNNLIDEAAAILQELQVETYGSMEKKEKIEFILEQMRLCLAKKDYTQTQIISKKISSKSFVDGSLEPLKLQYYRLMVELDLAEKNYLGTSKNFYEIYQCSSVQKTEEERLMALKNVMLFLLLAAHDNEQNDLLYRHKANCSRDLEKLPVISEIVEALCTREVILWREFVVRYEAGLRKEAIFTTQESAGEARWQQLHDRITQHNVRVMAAYYSCISLARMATLLDVAEPELERFLADLVLVGSVHARIDRLDGVVHFVRSRDASAALELWSGHVDELLGLVKKTNHLINKEKMVHQLA